MGNQVTMNATMRITLCLCLLFAIADLAWGGACDGCSKRCSGQPGTCGWSCTCKSWAESTILCGYEYQPDWCDRIEPDSLRIEATTSELMSTLVKPSFTICDADELDGGITKDEIHAPECLGFLFSLAGACMETDDVDSIFNMMDVDSNGSVTEKEFLNKALTMI